MQFVQFLGEKSLSQGVPVSDGFSPLPQFKNVEERKRRVFSLRLTV